MKKRAVTFVTFAQSLFLSLKLFFQNGLLSYSSACSFALIFSVVPFFLMAILIAVRVLHASPELITSIYKAVPELQLIFDPQTTASVLKSVKFFSRFEFLLVFFIIWMGRKLFASVFSAMRNIFHDQQKRRAIFNQILAFVFELLFVSIIVSAIFGYMSVKAILKLPFFQRFPQLDFIYDGILSTSILPYLPNFFILIAVVLMYKIASGTKPKFRLCLAAGFICTVSFWIFRAVLHVFLNVSRYNLIYGVLGNVIVLLLDIYFFFVFFLFFAQYIFVVQFFDELLLGELYLLPKKEGSTFSERIRRLLFIRPDFLLANPLALTYLSAGEKLYREGDRNSFAYYILKGCIKLDRMEYDEPRLYHRGEFFGELNSILAKPRTSTATAITDAVLVKIRGKTFRFLVDANPAVSQKVLKELRDYLTKMTQKDNSKFIIHNS